MPNVSGAAVLESQAFGAYRPDYAAALSAKDNQDPLRRGETLHHDPAATAAAVAAGLVPGNPESSLGSLDPVGAPEGQLGCGKESAADAGKGAMTAIANGGMRRPQDKGRGAGGAGARRCAAAVNVQVWLLYIKFVTPNLCRCQLPRNLIWRISHARIDRWRSMACISFTDGSTAPRSSLPRLPCKIPSAALRMRDVPPALAVLSVGRPE